MTDKPYAQVPVAHVTITTMDGTVVDLVEIVWPLRPGDMDRIEGAIRKAVSGG